MKTYYLSPKSWNRDSYRDVLTSGDIAGLPDDWDIADCDLIGDFNSAGAAWDAARGDNNLNPRRP
jgi:hypothetical protein